MLRAAEAASAPGGLPNLVFYAGDIRESTWNAEFALAAATRVLQWLPDPDAAVARMAAAVVPGGLVVVRDYDHTSPSGAVNRSLDTILLGVPRLARGGPSRQCHRQALARARGRCRPRRRRVTPEITTVRAGDPDFFRAAGMWRMVIESRGRQMVHAGHLTEAERRAALSAYTEWMQEPSAIMTLREAS